MGNDGREQELSVLCLRVLPAALVYGNALMVQNCRRDEWTAQLTDADRRAAHLTVSGHADAVNEWDASAPRC